MAISFESALGIHEQALHVRTTRARLIANNLANSETPNFKARDIDFRSILADMSSRGKNLSMRTTDKQHLAMDRGGITLKPGQQHDLLYRTPAQANIDGNSVDENIEHSEFLENAMAFQASFTLLNKKFSGLKTAIRGE